MTHDERIQDSLRRYWRANLITMAVLLSIWAALGLGGGVLFADYLNEYRILGGIPLGFWMAQQGAIIGFVFLILIYALLLNRLDRKHHDELTRLRSQIAEKAEAPESNDESGVA